MSAVRDYYKTIIVGSSGKGKTYSARNLNRETTGFINVENKPLPFGSPFKYHTRCNAYQEAFAAIIEYGKNPEIECIFFDSFSAYIELLLTEARRTKKGFDIWNYYNEEITKLFNLIKRVPKEVYILAHYEMLSPDGVQEKRVKVKGKEWEGLVEKEFTIVLYADRKITEDKKIDAWFDTILDASSAKCPPDIISEAKIPNDCQFIQDKLKEFFAK